MHKIKKPCGFHCIKMKDIGVQFGDQVVLEHINPLWKPDSADWTQWCGEIHID